MTIRAVIDEGELLMDFHSVEKCNNKPIKSPCTFRHYDASKCDPTFFLI